MDSKWQWLTSSQTRLVGIVLLILAFIMFLALMVLISPKATKNKVAVNTPKPNPVSSPLPDLTKDWKTVSFAQISLKIPPEATTSTKIKDKLSSLQIIASNSSKPILIIESFDHPDNLYQKNPSSSATLKMITKPIEILIGGVEGFEYYFEGESFAGFETTYPVDKTKHRVIQFDKGSKAFVIFSNLNPASEQILNTIKF